MGCSSPFTSIVTVLVQAFQDVSPVYHDEVYQPFARKLNVSFQPSPLTSFILEEAVHCSSASDLSVTRNALLVGSPDTLQVEDSHLITESDFSSRTKQVVPKVLSFFFPAPTSRFKNCPLCKSYSNWIFTPAV
jgi:hypothetical protein